MKNMEELLQEAIELTQNGISETEEFSNALPELCDYCIKEDLEINSQTIISFLNRSLQNAKYIGIEEFLAQDFFVDYPQIAKLVLHIYNNNSIP